MMKFSDKILTLRKQHQMSQEDLAESLNVSRQAISRWEMGSAQPDANNILQISKLFGVTTDYLLHDEYENNDHSPQINNTKEDSSRQIMIYLITLEVMFLILQFMCVIILQNIFFAVMSFIPFVAAIGGFEYAFRKISNQKIPKENSDRVTSFRRKFYKISAWLGTYFPIRLLVMALTVLYPRPYSTLALECVILSVYITTATLCNLAIEKTV